jgi:hypothetical protein
MYLILISLVFVLGFALFFVTMTSYSVFLFEKQRVEDQVSNLNKSKNPSNHVHFENRQFLPKTNNMKISPKINEYIEKTIVIVKKQDYKGWFDKSLSIVKKIAVNIGFYSKLAIQKIIEKTTSKPKEPNPLSIGETKDVEKIINKVNETKLQNENDFENNFSESKFTPERNKARYTNATIDIVSDNRESINNSTVYEKIEKNLLEQLRETKMADYSIWLKLGKHYEKYAKKQEAIDIYSYIMKNCQGREKQMARDGLIGLE